MNEDRVARDSVQEALARIDKHEAVCAERWLKHQEDVQAIRRGIEGLYNRFWIAALAVIGVLFSTCGYLVAHTIFGKG